jgi:rod shape determining protein RodA
MKTKDVLEIDFFLLFSTMVLVVMGILFIYSSGISATTGTTVTDEYIKQIMWGTIGLVFTIVLTFIDYKHLYNISIYLYLGTLALLSYTCITGRFIAGTRAWIEFGVFSIQPSEFTKITTIILLARYLDATKQKPNAFLRFLISCIIVVIPMGIILIQPDLGTSLVFIPILLIMTFVAGVSIRYIIFLGVFILLTGFLMVLPLYQSYILKTSLSYLVLLNNSRFITLVCVGLLIITAIASAGLLLYKKKYFFWIIYCATLIGFSFGASYISHTVLKEYQIQRLIVFLDPEVDPLGAGWNIIQSITAIGSGGLAGKGYLQGTQSQYQFLPVQSTDFIFSILSEEWGFIGGVVTFALFLVICLRLITIMKVTVDTFGRYISAGLSAMYIFHFLINVGMTMGIMPITGIPLLFMSYGGSALLSAMIGIGLALSIYIRRYDRSLRTN